MNQELALYTTEYHGIINKFLRNASFKPTPEEISKLERIIPAIKNQMVYKEFELNDILYRGIGRNATDILNHRSFVDSGFVSTSRSLEVATRFGHDVMAISVVGGARCAMPLAKANEQEVLLHPGGTFYKCGNEMIKVGNARVFPYVFFHSQHSKAEVNSTLLEDRNKMIKEKHILAEKAPPAINNAQLQTYINTIQEHANDLRELGDTGQITQDVIEDCMELYGMNDTAKQALYKAFQVKAHGGTTCLPSTRIVVFSRTYKVFVDKESTEKYIRRNHARVYLKSLRGKYRYVRD